VAVVLAAVGVREAWSLLALALSAFVVLTIAFDTGRAVAARRAIAGEGAMRALGSLLQRNQRRYGGFVVHLGVVLIVLGITGSMNWSQEKEATLAPGERVRLGRYTLQFEGLKMSEQPTHTRVEAAFRASNDQHDLGLLSPALKFFPNQQSPLGRAVLNTGWAEDLYVILSGFSEVRATQVTVKVLVRPMVGWIWAGGGVMVLGTLLALWPFRRPLREA
jgi:cytochrome c-type biogenesis protein CcmF